MLVTHNELKAVSLAMAKDDIRFYLNGMLLECNGQTVRLVATDGPRLHIMDIAQPEPYEGEPPLSAPVIMPRALVDWALKSSKKGQSIAIAVVGTAITATVNGASMTATAIDGRFPDYLRVLPHSTSGTVGQFNPKFILDAYAAVELISPRQISCRLNHNGEGCATVAYKRFAAVIMPLREQVGMTGTSTTIDAGLLKPL